MSTEADPQIVQRILDLTDFDRRTATILAARGRAMSVPAHWALMAEQTPADEVYLLTEGRVVIRQHQQDIAELGPGAFLGEMAFVNHRLRSASAIALTPVRALHFTREAVEKLSDRVPAFADALQEAARQREQANADRASGPV